MKILRIIVSMNPESGGPSQGIRNSISEMKKLGVENEAVCFDSTCYMDCNDFIIHTLGDGKTAWNYNKKLIPFLLKNFHRFEAVIVHGLWQYHSYAAVRAWKKYKKANKIYPKLFIMPHGMLDPYFQRAKERRLKAVRNWVYWKFIENKTVNSADGILFTCEEELRLAREPFKPYKPKQELNVNYGIQSPPCFSEKYTMAFTEKNPAWNGKPFILFLSRIHEKKGVDLLINAYCKLQTDFKNIPQLVIAGPAESEYAKKMKKLAENNADILFAGMLNGDAKWGAFYSCECFILPSHQENFGIAIVEAMACGKPVLITDKVNIWREIAGENAGFVGEDTEKSTVNMLKKWFSLSSEEKCEMQKNALRAYQKYFSIEQSAEKFINALKISNKLEFM
ncbi:MAG: glycosyltransferase [Prevotellaceae bacterium]|jgi:glycosyltransferase involved in cell wall biosynthesis|nr:glycosyltransferase [Prevotellaceae bacterium]